jgi:thioredoxin-dependent adenylylsulfate APS reductase
VLAWGLEHFAPARIALCTSFQKEGSVLLDMALSLRRDVQVFTIDTGRLPEATLELIDTVRTRYGVRIEVLYPDQNALSDLISSRGINLFYESVDNRVACCEVRKVEPLRRRLQTLDCWIAGLRREQSETRASVAEVEYDAAHGGLVKLNPLAGWTRADVEGYIAEHAIPVNALYMRGYASIGCAPCTRAVQPGEDERAGRWWWENGNRECGMNFAPDAGGARS